MKYWARIKATGEEFRVDRIDFHVYPICANSRRWSIEEVDLFVKKEDYPGLWSAWENVSGTENHEFKLPDLKGKYFDKIG